MNMNRPWPSRLAALLAASMASTVATGGAAAAAASPAVHGPTVAIEGGAVGGQAQAWGFVFRGLPYAAPPTGHLRWRPPHAPRAWNGLRDATHFAPSCPQAASPFIPPGRMSEDCLYLNVATPTLHRDADRPVLV